MIENRQIPKGSACFRDWRDRMKRVVIAPDSFKGTLSAKDVCGILSRKVLELCPDAEISCIPMSDGGEGLVESCLSLGGGARYYAEVAGPKDERLTAEYGILPDNTAVIEMASCAGLPLMAGKLQPLHASTYGVGELIAHISAQGHTKILMGLGGSATNDCGIGMAAALGYRFLDVEGKALLPYAYNLGNVAGIAAPRALPKLEITAACDVNNPLCGERGAAAVFGPQKGLRPEQIGPLDAAMEHFAAVIERELGLAVRDIPGSGAAGGLGAGVLAFLGASLKPGIELLLDSAGFDTLVDGADLVITGEGRLDGQSVSGKVPVGVAKRAKKKGVRCIALCGCLGEGAERTLEHGISAYYAATDGTKSIEELKLSCFDDLSALAERVLPAYL